MSQELDTGDSGAGTARTMVTIVATLTGVSAMFVAARLFVRIKLRSLGLDDYLIVLAMICAFVNLGISSAAAASGSGRHFDTLSLEDKQNVIKYTMAAFCPGVLSFAIPKLAVVALLTKLLNPSPAHRILLWCSTSVTAIVIFGCVIILYAQCTPSRSQWDFSVEGECWSPWTLVNYSIFAGALSAFMDLYLAIYPAVILAQLQMNVKKKAALGVALGIGSVSCVVAAYKCTQLPSLASDDFSYNTANLVIWTCVEGSTIIIASCIPILQPLVKVIFDKNAFSSARRGASSNNRTPYSKPTHGSKMELSSELVKSGKAYSRAKIGVSCPTELDSQEHILRNDDKSAGHSAVQSNHTRSGEHPHITRVDEITVSYSSSNDEAGKGEGSKRW
ncbi:hypothetical protein Q7P36_011408 [Cladosporium allicinum]